MTARHNNSVGNCCTVNSNTSVLEESVPQPTIRCQSINQPRSKICFAKKDANDGK